jgi:hypothetical protein
MSSERDERRQYDHRPDAGETRYPPESGEQHSGVPGQRDPHEPLNTPLSELDEEADVDRIGHGGGHADVTGMGRQQRGDKDQSGGDPTFGTRPDREERNPGQNTPFGETDAEAEAVHRAEEATGVPLEPDS